MIDEHVFIKSSLDLNRLKPKLNVKTQHILGPVFPFKQVSHKEIIVPESCINHMIIARTEHDYFVHNKQIFYF